MLLERVSPDGGSEVHGKVGAWGRTRSRSRRAGGQDLGTLSGLSEAMEHQENRQTGCSVIAYMYYITGSVCVAQITDCLNLDPQEVIG
jgi:hypothetical protein